MNSFDAFCFYWSIAGIIYGVWFLFHTRSSKWQDKVRDIVWNTGFDENFIVLIGFLVATSFGGYLLPRLILKKLGIIKSEGEE